MPDKQTRAITRPHRLKIEMHGAFRHSLYVREVVFEVSKQTGIRDFHAVCNHLYGKLRDPTVKASVTVTAIRDGVAAANAYRTAMENGNTPSEPEFKRPVVKLTNQNWRLNQIAEGYVARANVGSRESPQHGSMINVPRSV